MSDQTPHRLDASGEEQTYHHQYPGLDANTDQRAEAALVRFTLSCTLVAGLGLATLEYGLSLELAVLMAAVGAAIVMVHEGKDGEVLP